MIRSRLLTAVAALGTAALLGACGDASPTSPAATPSLGWKSTSTSGGHKTVTFTVYPGLGSMVNVDEHRIVFEPNAICDMAKTSYGPAHWNEPCPLATKPVRITAVSWHDADGRPRVDFKPALRFSPAARVTLYLRARSDENEPQATILWVSPDGTLVDEAATDPSVATRTAANGFKYRRVKHFSGYTLTAGRLGRSYDAEYLRGGGQLKDVDAPQLNSGHVIATGAMSEGTPFQQ
jgi:hypothetical protein